MKYSFEEHENIYGIFDSLSMYTTFDKAFYKDNLQRCIYIKEEHLMEYL